MTLTVMFDGLANMRKGRYSGGWNCQKKLILESVVRKCNMIFVDDNVVWSESTTNSTSFPVRGKLDISRRSSYCQL